MAFCAQDLTERSRSTQSVENVAVVEVRQEVAARPQMQCGTGDSAVEFMWPAGIDKLVVTPRPDVHGDAEVLGRESPRPVHRAVLLDHALGLSQCFPRH